MEHSVDDMAKDNSCIGKTNQQHYAYFSNRECEFFPCHEHADRDNFNCLFCYCPLYVLGEACGGNYCYTEDGRKDCSACMVPHQRENYEYIINNYERIVEIMKKI